MVRMSLKSVGNNLKSNLWLLISAVAVFCLYINLTLGSVVFFLLCVIVVLSVFGVNRNISTPMNQLYEKIISVFISFVIAAKGFHHFYTTWLPSSKAAALAGILGTTSSAFLVVLALFGCVVGMYAIYTFSGELVYLCVSCFKEKEDTYEYKHSFSLYERFRANRKQAEMVFLILLLSVVGIVTLCSKSSPLYPFNDWVDSNCFMTVGKSMLSGKVPYRDLYEQKGPMLYALHAVEALVSRTSFLGVYFIEIIAAFFFLYYSYRSLQIFCGDRAIAWIPVLAVIVYASKAFCHGDSAEELCLPLFAYGIWTGMKAISLKRFPSCSESLAIGITSGCVLWIKYNLLGFYIGWFIALVALLYQKKHIREIFRMLGTIITGIIVSTLPWMIYFGLNNALSDLFTVYFYDNLNYYTTSRYCNRMAAVLDNLYSGYSNIKNDLFICLILLLLGSIWLMYAKQKKMVVYFALAFAAQFFFVYIGGRHYSYYALIFSTFAIFGLIALDSIVLSIHCKFLRWVYRIPFMLKVELVLCLAIGFIVCPNTYFLQYQKSDLPQYQFKRIIERSSGATLLNYGVLDLGLYTVCDIEPDCRYFCGLNSANPAIMQGQDDCIKSQSVNYVVTRDSTPDILDTYEYTCIASSEFYHEGSQHMYYLYELQKNVDIIRE